MIRLPSICLAAGLLVCLGPENLSGADRAETLMLGNRAVRFEIVHGSPPTPGPVFLSLHSNEKTSIEATKRLLTNSPGRMIALDANGARRLHLAPGERNTTIDPNRMFTLPGIERDIKRYSTVIRGNDAELVQRFGREVLERYVLNQGLIVAIHNNTDGSYSILSYRAGGSEAAATGELFINPAKDPDDFFLVTVKSHFDTIKRAGFNVVLQSPAPPDDGSLSVYCGLRRIPYVNVEAQSGHLDTQLEMLRFVVEKLVSASGAPRRRPTPLGQNSSDAAAKESELPRDLAAEADAPDPGIFESAPVMPVASNSENPTAAREEAPSDQFDQTKAFASRLCQRAIEVLEGGDEDTIRSFGRTLAGELQQIDFVERSDFIRQLSPEVHHAVLECIELALGTDAVREEFGHRKP